VRACRVAAACLALSLVLGASVTHAQPAAPARFEGTVVAMTGSAEIEVANDEALASFYLEVQDADLARAQAQVNQRMAEATAALKRADARAEVQTSGYQSFPVYRDNTRKPVGWRVRQGVTLRTADLAALPRTVAAAQQHVALGGVDFRLSRAARDRVGAELIQQAIANLNSRIAAAAQAMQVPPSRVRTEELDFGGRGFERPPMVAMARAAPMAADSMPEPQFEAGRSLQQLTVSARVRFLP
jgi:predicted secreted protein